MALVPAATWQRYLDISVAYAEAGERVGRAEEKAEQYRSRLEEARERVTDLEQELKTAEEARLARITALEEQLKAAQARRSWWRRR
jgi:hypothetical protein